MTSEEPSKSDNKAMLAIGSEVSETLAWLNKVRATLEGMHLV